MRNFLVVFLSAGIFFSCSSTPEFETNNLPPVHTYLNYIKDGHGRYVYFHGLNVSGSDKFPVNDDPCTTSKRQCTYDKVLQPSYVGKPFPIEEADKHFEQIRSLGFNSIRLIMNWEAIQPDDPHQLDTEYLDFIERIVSKANEYGIYVLMDMHQDIFSRHLMVYYNDILTDVLSALFPPGSPVSMFTAFIPPYSNIVRGDGAPRWAVKAIMPEKDLDSPVWGFPRILGNLTDPQFLETVTRVIGKLVGEDMGFPGGYTAGDIAEQIKNIIVPFIPEGHYPYDITETTDLLPWTTWGINAIFSLDIQRCFAAFFAGNDAYPTLTVNDNGEEKNIQDFLQDAYARAWAAVAARVGKYPNVIGYDIINEPVGFFLTLTIAAAFFEIGSIDALKNFLGTFLDTPDYPTLASDIVDIVIGLGLLPPDTSEETRRKWGFEHADLMGIMGINYGFDKLYLQPFYEKIGKAILAEDPDAVIWIEPTLGLETVLSFFGAGGESPFQLNMTKPDGLPQVVYAPHWYADIYPFPGFNMPPREFTPEEVKFRDYRPGIESAIARATHSLGNVPVVLGEFGTYFNFNSEPCDGDERCPVSEEILDNYYEVFEDMFLSHMQWCWSMENDPDRGEGWNNEDFSVVDWNLTPRGEEAYSRPHPTFLSGKPVSMHFYSKLHYFDPEKGIVNPEGEFELKFESRETDAPTVIYIPYGLYYPDGFYVWISDGYAVYRHHEPREGSAFAYGFLYWYPTADDPGYIHSIRILPPLPGNENTGWQYFFKENTVVNGVSPAYPR